MYASELIQFLQDIIEQHGDYEVLTLCFDCDGVIVIHDSEEIIF